MWPRTFLLLKVKLKLFSTNKATLKFFIMFTTKSRDADFGLLTVPVVPTRNIAT